MLRPEPMVKLQILCAKQDLQSIIEYLYDAKALDIKHHDAGDIDIGKPLDEISDISGALVKLRTIMYSLGYSPVKRSPRDLSKSELKKAFSYIEDLHSKIQAITEERRNIAERKKKLQEEYSKLKALKSLGPLDIFRETKRISFIIGYVQDNFPDSLGENTEVLRSGNLAAVFYEKSREGDVLDQVKNSGFTEFKMPEMYDMEAMEKELVELHRRSHSLDNQISELKNKNRHEVTSLERTLSIYAKKAEAPLMFGETKNIGVITGWVPEKAKKKFLARLPEDTHVEELPTNGEAPVKIRNSRIVKPYEALLEMFTYPSYREIDPSIFMFITFPLFFGFMLGDVGYGLVTLLLFHVIKKKNPAMASFLNILMFSAISSIIFGLLYGEFFGFHMSHWGPIENLVHSANIHYPFMERNAGAVMQLITTSLIVGFIHVNLGVLIGFFNAYRAHGLKDAILEKGSWFIIEIALALGYLGYQYGFGVWYGVILGVIAVVMLYKGEGTIGIVEIPTFFIHMASYLRLMAIGMASVSLAVVVNEQVGPLFGGGPLMIFGGIILFAIGHTINIGLGVLGPFLHSLRLHYVEYFTKFYKGGGRKYQPFGTEV